MKGVRPVGFLDKLFGRKKTTREQPVQPADQPAIASDREEPVAAEPQEGVAMEPVTPAFQPSQPSPAPEATPAEENPADAPPPASPQREWDAVTQRKLDRYFARLREIYPDGVIARLNTGQKSWPSGARSFAACWGWRESWMPFSPWAALPIAARAADGRPCR